MEHTYQVLNLLEHQESTITKLMALRRGYVLHPSDTLKELLLESSKGVLTGLNQLDSLIDDNDLQKKNLRDIRNSISRHLFFSDQWFRSPHDTVSIDSMKSGIRIAMPALDKIIRDLEEMKKVEHILLETRSFIQRDSGAMMPLILLVTGLCAIGMLVFSYYLLAIELKERLKAKEALERNVQHLNLANEELERFAFIASHNLKEPLRKARTFVGRALHDVGSENPLHSKLEKMGLSMERLQSMLDDLLVYTKLQHHSEIKERIMPDKIIREVLSEMRDQMQALGVEVTVTDLPPVDGFTGQVTLVFRHLFSNSLKYRSLNKKPVIRISSSFNQHSGHQVIHFEDNGIGFDPAFKQKVFEIFGRLHSKDDYEGTGIGLAICRRVMTNHNGHIVAESSPGHGTTIRLYFPV